MDCLALPLNNTSSILYMPGKCGNCDACAKQCSNK